MTENSPTTYTLGHLSDPHLGPLPQPKMRELASKRMIGYVNWQRNRVKAHLEAPLLRLMDDLLSHEPDHIAVTGDLVNLALKAELAPAGSGSPRSVAMTMSPSSPATTMPTYLAP